MAASAALAACGGGSSSGEGDGAATGPDVPPSTLGNHPAPLNDRAATRFLLQAQFSASPREISELRAPSYAEWLQRQFSTPPSLRGRDWLNERGYGEVSSSTAYYDNCYPGDYMIWYQLMQSPDGLRRTRCSTTPTWARSSAGSSSGGWRPATRLPAMSRAWRRRSTTTGRVCAAPGEHHQHRRA